jgi:shikimate kinase
MVSGKTTIGRLAAKELDMDFIDTDSMIEEISDCTIGDLFSKNGEHEFRKIERKVIREVSKRNNAIIATGGGAVLCSENMRRLRSNGIIVNLTAEPAILLERLKDVENRPLLAEAKNRQSQFLKYLAERAEFYSNADFRLDTGRMNIEESVERLCDISELHFVRICGCISGKNAEADIQMAVVNGVSMIELRLDLIPNPDVESLVRNCPVPVIATDRKNKEQLKEAMLAGCNFIDIETESPDKHELIKLARQSGCKVIVSLHDFEGIPIIPEKGDADLLKVAVTVNSKEDVQKLIKLHGQRDDVIIVGMGPRGTPLRMFAPLLGSYLTYCSIGEKTAPGQLDLQTMIRIYKELGLR